MTGDGTGGTDRTDTLTRTPTPNLDSQFDTVLDAVEDLGCDASGKSPCDENIADAVGSGVVITFPSGTYRFEEGHRFTTSGQIGFVGKGDVTFKPPRGFNDKLIGVIGGHVLFRGINIDVSENDTTAGLRFISDSGFVVEDIELRGRGTHPDGSVVNALALAVQDADKRGIVRNFVAGRGSAIGQYKGGNGRVGIWVGGRHEGTMQVMNSQIGEFGNNGMYASRCPGKVQVRNSTFWNNSPSSVRIGGQGSFVDGCSFTANLGAYTGPDSERDEAETRGIVIERGGLDKPPGAEVRNCQFQIKDTPPPAPGIHVWPTGQSLTVKNSTFEIDYEGSVIHRSSKKRQGDHPPAEKPRWVHLENVTITGTGRDSVAIQLYDAPGSTIRNCRVDPSGVNFAGVRLSRSNRSVIDGGAIRTPGFPIIINRDDLGAKACLLQYTNQPTIKFTSQDTCPQLPNVTQTPTNGSNFTLCELKLFTKQTQGNGQRTCIGTDQEFPTNDDGETVIAITSIDGNRVGGMLFELP